MQNFILAYGMYPLLLLGFVFLVKGADFFVEGSSSIAKLLGVPSVVIGLTIVAMGTSAPECAVSVTAGLAGSNEIAISNVIGSNLFNMLVVTGVCAAIRAFKIDADILKRDFPVNGAASALLMALLFIGTALGRIDGIVLLACMAIYLFAVVSSAIKNREKATEDVVALTPVKSVVYVLGGLVAIIFGGNLVVDNATLIAQSWGWSETFIGLTIIAIGTSLPELVTSIVAARKGESGLALGNVVGSNIFNILLILGISSTLHPIAADSAALVNTGLLLVSTVALYLWCRWKKEVTRPVGLVMVGLYAAYTVYQVMLLG